MSLGTAVKITQSINPGTYAEWQVLERNMLSKWRDFGVLAHANDNATVGTTLFTVITADISGTTITLGNSEIDGGGGYAVEGNTGGMAARMTDTRIAHISRSDIGIMTLIYGNTGTWPSWSFNYTGPSENHLYDTGGVGGSMAMLGSSHVVYTRRTDGSAVVVEIDASLQKIVSLGGATDFTGLLNIVYNINIVPRGDTEFEIYWSTAVENGDIKCVRGTRTGTTLSFGTVFTVHNGGTRCYAAAVNSLHTVVTFANDNSSRSGSAVLVYLQNLSKSQGSTQSFNPADGQTASIAVASAEDDTFFIVAATGSTWEVDTYNVKLYRGVSDGALAISSISKLEDTVAQGKRVDITVAGANTLVMSYDRTDDLSESTYLVAYEYLSIDMQILGMSLSKGAGDRLYVTGHTGSELALKVYEYPALTELAAYSLGPASPAQVAARTYWAIPYAPYGLDDQVFVLGRLNDPGGLGLVHLIVSVDAGATFDIVENGLGTSHVGAAVETDTWDTYFVVNGASSGCKLYQYDPTGDKIDLKSTIPVTGWCEPHGITQFGNNLIVGNGSADAKLVVYAAPPFANWFDLTFDHATANGLNAVVALP